MVPRKLIEALYKDDGKFAGLNIFLDECWALLPLIGIPMLLVLSNILRVFWYSNGDCHEAKIVKELLITEPYKRNDKLLDLAFFYLEYGGPCVSKEVLDHLKAKFATAATEKGEKEKEDDIVLKDLREDDKVRQEEYAFKILIWRLLLFQLFSVDFHGPSLERFYQIVKFMEEKKGERADKR
ncbi:hypothetical protein G7Y89_g4010 [Cudoniella acicularis]|uniref:Uncharacterized protein n=1 Tax=Cudoniella acicularis TaxID=354080 RepID=A0A8H4RRI3_9HELO|nr:hypothetical protein G7Y89_g4010 [Cudoniella acicularis]